MSDVSIEIAGVKDRIGKLKKFFEGNPQMLDRIGIFAAQQIITRTLAGQDHEGKAFKQYSNAYSFFRQSRGYPTKPDLFFSGRMQAALTHLTEIDPPRVILFFASPEEGMKAASHHFGLGNLGKAKREFFALHKEDAEIITGIVEAGIKKTIEE